MRAFPISALVLLLLAPPSTAQVFQYHVDIVEASTGQIAFSNDSPVAVEAYHVTAECGAAGMTFADDILFTPRNRPRYSLPSGWTVPDHLGVRAYERVVTRHHLTPQPSGCAWQSKVDGVIFADGQYRGDTAVIEMMQAYRKGMTVALLAWKSKLANLNLDRLSMPQAESTAVTTGPSSYCVRISRECGLRNGQRQINANLLQRAKSKATDDERFQYVLSEIERWQKKFDTDAAYSKLSLTFPSH